MKIDVKVLLHPLIYKQTDAMASPSERSAECCKHSQVALERRANQRVVQREIQAPKIVYVAGKTRSSSLGILRLVQPMFIGNPAMRRRPATTPSPIITKVSVSKKIMAATAEPVERREASRKPTITQRVSETEFAMLSPE